MDLLNATNFLFDLWKVIWKDRNLYLLVLKKNNVIEQSHDAIVFNKMNVTECYCKIGSEFYLKDRRNISYGTNHYKEALNEIVSFNTDYNGLPRKIKP